VLVLGPSWVGDMVMAQPLLALLKNLYPQVKIDVAVPAAIKNLLVAMPEVNRGISLPFRRGQLDLKQRFQIGRTLRASCYDQAIVLPNSWKSAIVPCIAKIPIRTGWLGEQRWGLLNDIRRKSAVKFLQGSQYPLAVQRFLVLALEKGAPFPTILPTPRLLVSKQSIQSVLHRFGESQQKPILGLCPGAAFGNSKRWLPEYFSEIAQAYLKMGWAVWLFGSSEERAFAELIQKSTENRCRNFTGLTNLLEVTQLISLASAVVSNDSGLMHVADALNVPQVVVYGSTSPLEARPFSQRSRLLHLDLACAPCFKRECPLGHYRCMRDLVPSMVLEALQAL